VHPLAELQISPGSVGIHWFEQNAYALRSAQGTIVLIDPFFPHHRPPERFIRPGPPVRESELPTDYVLLTHDHMDHTNPETIARIHAAWPEAQYVGPEDAVARVLSQTKVDKAHTTAIAAGNALSMGPLTVHAFWSKPPDGDAAAGIPPANAIHLGYVIELIAPIAALRPDIGFLTTHPTEGEFPFFEGSVRMAIKLGLKTAVPAHYACFAKRTYDPQGWAALFPADGPQPLVIPWNSHVIYP
jgi:L-ascorbate metabolism protein UlaG (beta-lactamase superfamily)